MSRQNSFEISSLEVTVNNNQVEIDPIGNGTKPFDDVKVMLVKGADGTGTELALDIADAFSSSQGYVAGVSYCIHEAKLYKCILNHQGAWNANHFTQVTVDDAFMAKGRDRVTAGRLTGSSLGGYATAEGFNNVASGNYSHVEGYYNKTGCDYQHIQGKYNVGKADTAFEIGNGTSDNARSNALEVDWDGNVSASGDIEDGGGNVLSNKLDTSKLVLIRQKINASGWSPNPINGYYATSLYTTDSFRTSPTPSIKATGASDSTLITDAQAEAYEQILFPNGYVEQNGNTRFDLYAKTKPTSDFYILIEGILV